MGNDQSNLRPYHKLTNVMPSLDTKGCNTPATSWFDKSSKPFASEKDRDQFIYATISVLSQNGRIDLQNHDFRLLYSRRGEDDDRIVAHIVAEKGGVISAQVQPAQDGKDQCEAFKALRRHVEIALEKLLSSVPGAAAYDAQHPVCATAGVPGPSSGRSPASPTAPALPARTTGNFGRRESRSNQPALIDAPPAYGKAVSEWQSPDDIKKG
ncbi:hypothetical protein LTR37_001723 [Vermiconidia calcicola]|uniref:Uncharacterized protein n=1 Tax=Vermiconidia calcicola TaxID=1690605 RepID=A0ACC3NUJ9_9PEZI|nr:hypothetical protein LTR37_001723 [Vermiconidia calcicola]